MAFLPELYMKGWAQILSKYSYTGQFTFSRASLELHCFQKFRCTYLNLFTFWLFSEEMMDSWEEEVGQSIEDVFPNPSPIPRWVPHAVMRNHDQKCELTQLYKVFTNMQQFQRDNMFCDITIQVDGSTFHAHKVVLASSSDFFAAMLKSDFKENLESKATISGTPEAFQTLLDFAYSGKLNFSVETVMDVMEMAHYLQFLIVLKRCEFFLNTELCEK